MTTPWVYSGKTVLITGVARSGQIGHAVALAFGRAGAKIVAVDRNAVAVAERVREFESEGIAARPAAGDLSEADVAALAVETALKHYVDDHANGQFGRIGQPLRIAVTGGTVSPSLFETLEILGQQSTLARITRCLSLREAHAQ